MVRHNLSFMINAANGELPGEIDLYWEPDINAISFAVEMKRNKAQSKWRLIDIVNSSNYTVTGLKPGSRYCFRVAPVYKNCRGEWSIYVTKKAAI